MIPESALLERLYRSIVIEGRDSCEILDVSCVSISVSPVPKLTSPTKSIHQTDVFRYRFLPTPAMDDLCISQRSPLLEEPSYRETELFSSHRVTANVPRARLVLHQAPFDALGVLDSPMRPEYAIINTWLTLQHLDRSSATYSALESRLEKLTGTADLLSRLCEIATVWSSVEPSPDALGRQRLHEKYVAQDDLRPGRLGRGVLGLFPNMPRTEPRRLADAGSSLGSEYTERPDEHFLAHVQRELSPWVASSSLAFGEDGGSTNPTPVVDTDHDSELYSQEPSRHPADVMPLGITDGLLPWRLETRTFWLLAREAARLMREEKYDEFGWSSRWL